VERVYIETTIPSFYHTERTTPEMVVRRDWTREWWDLHRHEYEVVSRAAVLEELTDADQPQRDKMLAMLRDLEVLSVELVITEIVDSYIEHRVMPSDPRGDALHLALASFHKCDYLVTWNCKHLANARKFQHIRVVNAMLGLFIPTLITPLQLLEGGEVS
jgi:predicted nucleic acid-binding protein